MKSFLSQFNKDFEEEILGIIGEYIAKIFNQSIKKPLVIEKDLIGFND